jgi:ornithine cyclodeaminase/alanine dehydrogenase-like protein (mu-crystallin family)
MVDDSLGRTSPADVTLFAQRGDGIAFAGIGYALYELAESEDLGETLPTELFTQTYVP